MAAADYIDLSAFEEGYTIKAFVAASSSGRFEKYLDVEYSSELTKAFVENSRLVAVLKSIEVDEDLRGRGLGSEVLDEFLSRVEGKVDAVVLVANMHENNEFELDEWYESKGFETVYSNEGGLPVMVKTTNNNLISALREIGMSRPMPSANFANSMRI